MAENIRVGKAVLEFDVDDKGVITGLKKIKGEVQDTASSWSNEFKTMASVTGGLVLDRVISGVVNLGKEAFESAGKIVDLAEQTGLSIKQVQQLGFVSEQTGTSVENFANAAFKLGVNLEKAKAGDSVAKALEDIGLSLAQVQSLKPEEQFDLIARRLSEVDDVTRRNRDGVALMGKGYQDIAPGIADYTRLIDEANVASEDSVRALSDAGDAWDGFLSSVGAKSTEILGQMVLDGQAAVGGWSKFFGDIKATAGGLFDGGIAGAKAAHDEYMLSLGKQAEATDKGTIADGKAAAASREKAAALDKQQKALERAAKEQEAFNKEVNALLGMMRGDDLAKKVRVLEEAYNRLTPEQLENKQVTERLTTEVLRLAEAGAKLPPKLDDIARKAQAAKAELALAKITVTDFGKALEGIGKSVDLVDPQFFKLEKMLQDAQTDTDGVIGKIKDLGKEVEILPAPPQQPWFDFEGAALGVIDHISGTMATSITDMITGQASFKEGMLGIWGGIKSELLSIMDSILAYFIRNFLGGMVKGIFGANLGQALGGAISGGIASGVGGAAAGAAGAAGSSGAAAAAGAAGGSGIAGALGAIGLAALPPALFFGLTSGEEWQPNYGWNQYLASEAAKKGTSFWDTPAGKGIVDSMDASGLLPGEFGYMGAGIQAPYEGEPGYAWGTPNLDFESFRRSGEARMLHGDEAIVPRGGGHQLASEIAASLATMGQGARELVLNINGRQFLRAVWPDFATELEQMQVSR